MKKRLLSAALALAMVLTLLPVSVFAATTTYTSANATNGTSEAVAAQNTVGKSFKYQTATDYTTYAPVTLEEGKWYWVAPVVNGAAVVYEANSGFIVGKGGSGAWYPNEDAYAATKKTTLPTSFTLLSTQTFNLPMNTGVDVDLNGCDLTLNNLDDVAGTNNADITRITVTDSRHNKVGTLTLPTSVDRSAYVAGKITGVTLTATNVNINLINFKGRTNTVTLNNCAVAGDITLNGQSFDAKGAETCVTQNLTLNSSSVTGKVEVTGDRSQVKVQDSSSGTVDVTSDGGSVTVGGASGVDKITVGNRAAKGAIPTVTVNGGTVKGIEAVATSTTAASSFTINRTTNNITIDGDISTDNGSVSITNAAVTGAITVKAGSLTVGGDRNNIAGVATLGANGVTSLTINATNSIFGGFAAPGGNNLDIKAWPAGRGNYYGTLSLGSYNKGQIKGGMFSADTATELGKIANMGWVDNANLQFIVPVKTNAPATGAVALYGRTELTEAISSIAATTAATQTDAITVLGQGEGTPQYIKLMWGKDPWVWIKYNTKTGIYLPTRINNTGVAKWIVQNGSAGLAQGTSFTSGVEEAIPFKSGDDVVLSATDTTAEATRITNVTGSTSTTVENGDVRVRLNGNTIELSGAVTAGAGGYATIAVDLYTDVVDEKGDPVVIRGVEIDYNVNTKKVGFSATSLSLDANGAIVQDGVLVLNRGTGARYNVTANLAVSASALEIYDITKACNIVVTVGGKLSSWSATAKQELINEMQKDGGFTINGNRAVLEAINAAQATITSNGTIDTWIANAKQNIWKNGYTSPDGTTLVIGKHNGNFKDMGTVTGATADVALVNKFATAYIVPYLVVNVTDYTADGTLTATLTPYYRVDLSESSGYNPQIAYTLQAGKTLGVLSGDMSKGVIVNLGIASLGSKLHQDGKYVYDGSNAWEITHANASGGLGTVVVNKDDGLISMGSDIANRWGGKTSCPWKYDDLQAAVDDTIPGITVANTGDTTPETMDTITVDGNYKGNCSFTMTGYARKIKVVALGDLPIKCTSKDVDTQNPSGWTYTFQLKRDTAPTGGNITVNSATGGSAKVNANPASAGQTVTITLSANAGYTPSGVSVKDSTGKAVSVSGSGNTYTFTMPSGSVTVTPSFTQNQTVRKATVSVSPNSMGTTTTTAAATNNQVDSGSSVGVTTLPASGYRTMGVNISTNGGATTAIRQGDNYFTFTVPSNATAVTVTPIYDRDNGTKFSDVWSTEYYSNPVAWAVGRNITNGTSTYAFSPSVTCTRAQMMTFLWRAAGRPSVSGANNPFVDVYPSMGSDYYNAILWAVSKGITNGTDATHFSPSQTVTRAQAVTFLYRYAGSPTSSTSTGFYDAPSSEYYARAVSWANAKGITNGTSTNYFSPSQGVSRAQAVTFLYRHVTGLTA